MITISRAPAWLAVQDLGWSSHHAIGMPTGGAMDRHALAVANLLAGNPPDCAGLEWALGAGTIRFERPTVFALAGAQVEANLAGRVVPPLTTVSAASGEELTITRFLGGVFAYVAIHGGLAVEPLLGSRSTYLRGGFGGHHGRRLRAEDFLPLGVAPGPTPPDGFAAPGELGTAAREGPLRVTPGPQAGLFAAPEADKLVHSEWVVAAASDRMGYRLKGPAIAPTVPAALASEPACPGAVQIPDAGAPIVLMADGPTVGGYPKLAVVCSADLGRLAQCEPGARLRFAWIGIEEAQRLHRRQAIQLHTLASLISDARGS